MLLIESIIKFQTLKKDEVLLREGQFAKNIHFLCKGAIRSFFTDEKGNTYNKNIFLEGDFPASKVALLRNTPSYLTMEAFEESILINLNYKKYREFIRTRADLNDFYISYIEKNWIIKKEQREISLVMQNATKRYLTLLQKHPTIETRIPQLHIAAHLGVTPTQLSRIRKDLKKNN